MNLKFWKKEKNENETVNFIKTYDERIREEVLSLDEEMLKKIDLFKPGTKIRCIKDYGSDKTYFSDFRDFVKNIKKEFHIFNKNEIYEIDSSSNEYVYVKKTNRFNVPSISFIKNHPSTEVIYLFEYFILESEYIALHRDNQIEQILN